MSFSHLRRLLSCSALLFGLAACMTPSPATEQVLVAPLSSSGQSSQSSMTREELEDSVRRYADRYFTRIALATNELAANTTSGEHRQLMHDWKTTAQTAIVDTAIGQNAVTNLLDMMVATRLSLLVIDSYWTPNVFGETLGKPFRETYVELERDIWAVSDDVLTAQQQDDLRNLVDEWHAENPEQYFPWYVRLDNFSGQRAASLAAVKQTGGLLSEVARAREAAEEIQAFGERILFYLQRAPMITSNEFESGVGDILQRPDVAGLVTDTDRFVSAVEQLVQLVEDLPDEQIAAIDQFMDRLGSERRALLADVSETEPELRAVLSDLRPIIESLERTVAVAKQRNPEARPFNITEYTELVERSAVTAAELTLMLDAIDSLLGENGNATGLVDSLVAAGQAAVKQIFWYAVALFIIFFVLLLAYRLIASRVLNISR